MEMKGPNHLIMVAYLSASLYVWLMQFVKLELSKILSLPNLKDWDLSSKHLAWSTVQVSLFTKSNNLITAEGEWSIWFY